MIAANEDRAKWRTLGELYIQQCDRLRMIMIRILKSDSEQGTQNDYGIEKK